MKDALGQRMKERYEDRSRFMLPRRTYSIIRVDGKAFHSFTRKCKKPFDGKLINAMNEAALELCRQSQGAKLGYVQSDEISVLLTDFETEKTDMWLDGNIQKIASISASIVTAAFNNAYVDRPDQLALFDARVFVIPDYVEVENYFVWRQKDATRNSVQMMAHALYPYKELVGKKNSELQEMIFQKNKNWNTLPPSLRRGRAIYKTPIAGWEVDNAPAIFTEDRDYLRRLIPMIWAEDLIIKIENAEKKRA